jgi:hypothetical protein
MGLNATVNFTPPQVRKELAPWEAQMSEVQGRIDVATSERDMLLRKSEEAKVGLGLPVQCVDVYSMRLCWLCLWWVWLCLGADAGEPNLSHSYVQTDTECHHVINLTPPRQERLESARAQLAAAKQAAKDKGREIAAIEKEAAQTRWVAARSWHACFRHRRIVQTSYKLASS